MLFVSVCNDTQSVLLVACFAIAVDALGFCLFWSSAALLFCSRVSSLSTFALSETRGLCC